MLILGIETSGAKGGVALMEDGAVLGQRLLTAGGRRHAQTLSAEMSALFQETGHAPRDCDGVAVSIGPGSFTGLRIGVVTAKTLAYAVGCPIAAVDTLQAIAEECSADVTSLWVIADAQRGDLYVGRYHQSAGEWQREGSMTIHPAQAWCQARTAEDVVIGPGTSRWREELQDRCRVLPEFSVPSALTIARVGAKQIKAGRVADVWGLEPYYLRKSSAEEQWDIRHRNRI